MVSLLLLIASWSVAIPGTMWGVYIGRTYRRRGMSHESGLALAVVPPFIIAICLSAASVLVR